MASSSLITSINSAFARINWNTSPSTTILDSSHLGNCLLMIEMRNLKGLVLCLRNFGDDDAHLEPRSLKGILFWFRRQGGDHAHLKPRSLANLFLRIDVGAIAGRLFKFGSFGRSILAEEIHLLVKEVDDALSNRMIQSSFPMMLTVDEIVGIADCILDSTADFLTWMHGLIFSESTNAFEVIEAFQVQIMFMKHFLLFSLWAGFEVQDLLFHIQPIAIDAARVFIKDGDHHVEWLKNVESKCSVVNHMANDDEVNLQAYSQALSTSTCLRPSQNDAPMYDQLFKSFLDSLILIFWDVLRHSDSGIKDRFKDLYQRLRFSRFILNDIRDEEMSGRLKVLVCDAGVLIFSLGQVDPGRLAQLLERFDVLETHHSRSNNELDFADSMNIKVSDGSENGPEMQENIALMPTHQPPLSNNPPEIVGFQDDEVTSILDRLTRGSKQLRIIPISGMAGVGKTTLALKLYNHPSVFHHFHCRAWCPISQVLDKKKVLLHLLSQIDESGIHYRDMTENDLANSLRQRLKRNRYLILLDDVWNPKVWADLRASFPNDFTDSRIILTSRRHDIVPHPLPDEQPHLLRLREDHECLEILQTKLSHIEGWNLDVGVAFAKKCKGLPLTVVIVAGLLATTEKEGWEEILGALKSDVVSNADSALELGYTHLPDYLQSCFLYFGAFPEDEEICVKRLIRSWMAEGFVRNNEFKRTEDVARDYMEELIERSLVMVAQTRSIGGVSTCRIHDLLRDFCIMKAKQENFSHLLLLRDQPSEFYEPCNLQRLFIHCPGIHFKNLGLFYPDALAILFFPTWKRWYGLSDMSFIIQMFPLLKVLDIHLTATKNGIPSEIEVLTELRYFSICTAVPVIPYSVGKLSHLETFIADFRTTVDISFPCTLWNLENLKYLHIRCEGDGFTLPVDDLENYCSPLLKLDTLRGVVFYSDGSMEKHMSLFPNIRRLKCMIRRSLEETEVYKIVVPDFLHQLESLTVRGINGECKYEFGSNLKNLRKLSLDGFQLSREGIAVIGEIPSLEVLKLSEIHFSENVFEIEEGGFSNLRILTVQDCSIVRWTASDNQLPDLQKLVFNLCPELKEIPSCLWTNSPLEEIQVYACSDTLESLVKDIEKVHQDNGNSIKVHFNPSAARAIGYSVR